MAYLRNIVLLAAATLLAALPSTVTAGRIDDPELTVYNFHEIVGNKRFLCKMFGVGEVSEDFQERIWSKIEEKYENDPEIAIIEVNCQAIYGMQFCIDRSVSDTPELHYGDVTKDIRYDGLGDYDVLVEFIEKELRPLKSCGIVHPELCSEDDKADLAEIEKLTVKFFEDLEKFEINKPEHFANQAMMKFGVKNVFRNDYDDVDGDEDEDDEEELDWTGKPSGESDPFKNNVYFGE
jgi:hypothetical protein